MWRFYVLGFALLVAFDTVGQIGFKMTALQAAPVDISWQWIWRIISHHWFYIAVVGYLGSFITWMVLLKKAPVGPAFAAAHLQVVTVMILSIWLFKEQVNLHRLLGAVLIVLGILSLAFAEKQLHQKELAKGKQ